MLWISGIVARMGAVIAALSGGVTVAWSVECGRVNGYW